MITDLKTCPYVLAWAQWIMGRSYDFIELTLTVLENSVIVEDSRAMVEVPKYGIPNKVCRKLYL